MSMVRVQGSVARVEISCHSPSPLPSPGGRGGNAGFTLIEMLTTVAVLVIVLGLMVSLARDVRHRSAEALTTDILSRLDTLVDQYRAKTLSDIPERDWGKYPAVHPFLKAGEPVDEGQLQDDAAENNKDLVRVLKKYFDLSGDVFHDLSIANYNEVMVLDAWGRPIVYMPHGHAAIGMAANNRSFFFSAGPDRKYLTRQDNLYSYESATPRSRP